MTNDQKIAYVYNGLGMDVPRLRDRLNNRSEINLESISKSIRIKDSVLDPKVFKKDLNQAFRDIEEDLAGKAFNLGPRFRIIVLNMTAFRFKDGPHTIFKIEAHLEVLKA